MAFTSFRTNNKINVQPDNHKTVHVSSVQYFLTGTSEICSAFLRPVTNTATGKCLCVVADFNLVVEAVHSICRLQPNVSMRNCL